MKASEIANMVVRVSPVSYAASRTDRGGSALFFKTSDIALEGGTIIAGRWMNTQEGDTVAVDDCTPSSEEEYERAWKQEAEDAKIEAERNRAEITRVLVNTERAQAEFEDTIVLSVAFQGGFSNKKALTPEELAMINLDPSIDKAKFRGTKTLFVCKEFNAIGTYINNAHQQFASFGIPFPLRKGMHLININLIPEVEKMCSKVSDQLEDVVAQFVAVYPKVITPEVVKLGSLYRRSDYKPGVVIAESFKFSSRWLHFGTPDKLKQISNEFFAREQKRTAAIWEEAKQQGLALLRKELSELTDRLVDTLTPKEDGTRKKFYASSVTKLTDFLAVFDNRNIAGDKALEAKVDELKALLGDVNPATLGKAVTDSEKLFQDNVRRNMEVVKESLTGMVVDASARKITFEDEE